jgi:transcriptional regulator with XRE-family HTH domain
LEIWKKVKGVEGDLNMNDKIGKRRYGMTSRLGYNIKVKRVMKRLSQEDLAKMVRLSQSALSRIEQGRSDPKLSHVVRILEELGMEPNRALSTDWEESGNSSPQEKEMEPKKNLRDLHINIRVELDKKLDAISRFRGEKTHHIMSAIEAYLKKWESEHGGLRTK